MFVFCFLFLDKELRNDRYVGVQTEIRGCTWHPLPDHVSYNIQRLVADQMNFFIRDHEESMDAALRRPVSDRTLPPGYGKPKPSRHHPKKFG